MSSNGKRAAALAALLLALGALWWASSRGAPERDAGLAPSEMKRLKQLEEENRKLKRLVADLALDKQILQDAVSGKL